VGLGTWLKALSGWDILDQSTTILVESCPGDKPFILTKIACWKGLDLVESQLMKTETATQSPAPGYWQILSRYPQYRRLYVARLISMMGDWFSLIALIAMLREVTGGSEETLAWLFIVKMLPPSLMGPMAGVIADRFSRKTILIWSDLVRFFLMLGYFAVPLFPDVATTLVLTLAFLQACGSAFFEPARTALLPNLIPLNALGTANALSAATWSITYSVGSALGGLATYQLGWRAVLFIDAMTFLISALWLVRLKAPHKPKPKAEKLDLLHLTGVRDMIEGFAFIKGHARITYVLFIKTGLMFGGSMILVLTLFGERVYTLGGRADLAVGIFMSVRALGTGVGPVLARRWIGGSTERMRQICLIGFFTAGIFYIAFGLAGDAYLVLALVFIAHLGSSVVWVFSTVLLQRLVPDRYAGRVFAAELGMATLMISLSNWVTGRSSERGLVEVVDIPIYLGALVFTAGLVFWIWGRSKRLRGRFVSV